jgi:hypothetical protein
MTITQITDHADRALAFVLSQYDDSPRVRKLVEIIADQVQTLENVAWDVLAKRMLDDATGDILDRYGRIVQLQRLDSTDDEYRTLISVAIAANNSDAQCDTIAAVAAGCVGRDVRYIYDGPMHLNLEYETDDPIGGAHADRIGEMITRAVGGGVSWRLTEGSDIGEAFRLDVGPGLDVGKLGRIVTSEG